MTDKPKLLSKCCQAPLTVSTADEGTSCYICTSCGRDTDPMFEEKPKLPENTPLLFGLCHICEPPTPLRNHKEYRGRLIHSRTDVEPGVLYFINEDDFKLNEN